MMFTTSLSPDTGISPSPCPWCRVSQMAVTDAAGMECQTPTTVPRLEDFPPQSRRRDRVYRSVRRTHDLVQATLRPGHSSPCSPAAGEYQGDEQSDRRVDRGPGD